MFSYAGKTALVTGASSGIGAEFARQLSARGSDLVLVARTRSRLEALAAELSGRHGIRAEVVVEDLAREGAAARIGEEVAARGLRVDVLVNNAGFGTHGPFETVASEREHEEVMVNVTSVVDLTHAFLPAMVERGDGAVINVASTTAFQPTPYMAVYGATKAFVLAFSHALREENRKRGIRVLALCPGPTETPFFDVVTDPSARVGSVATPRPVVAAALRALDRGRAQVITGGIVNFALAQSSRFTTRAFAARVAGRMLKGESSRKSAEDPTLGRDVPSRGRA